MKLPYNYEDFEEEVIDVYDDEPMCPQYKLSESKMVEAIIALSKKVNELQLAIQKLNKSDILKNKTGALSNEQSKDVIKTVRKEIIE